MKTDLLKAAFQEDFSDIGDITGEAIFSEEIESFKLISKDIGILCGIKEFVEVMKSVDDSIIFNVFFKDSQKINKGDLIAEISGKVSSILKAERTALNILSHLSGIATKTNKFVVAANGRSTILG